MAHRVLAASLTLIMILWAADGIAAPRGSAMEPAAGTVPDGQALLVDDGTCPAGRIKQIIGGNMKAGRPRIRSCIRRP